MGETLGFASSMSTSRSRKLCQHASRGLASGSILSSDVCVESCGQRPGRHGVSAPLTECVEGGSRQGVELLMPGRT